MGIPENIDALLVKFDIPASALARIADVSESTVSRWRKGGKIRQQNLDRITAYFHLIDDDIISDSIGLAAKEHGRVPPGALSVTAGPVASVPLLSLGTVHAGDLDDEGGGGTSVEVPASVLDHHPEAFALSVEGDCMDRVIPEGAHVLVDPSLPPRNGSVCVVETQDYQAVMRRWYRGATTLLLCADSHEEYDDIVITGDDPIRVLGVVVWYQSADEMG